ncbi:MAG: hypothetical protein H0T76_10310 [Nannocystis sp.]|nr:nuclease A inhibitor family protein [Nannocystis sp.]MBA3546865.1 hypothetical protein [Nannocystis sp.]
MPSLSVTRPMLLAALLAACTADSGSTQSASDTASTTDAATTTGSTSTGATTGSTTTDATSTTPTDGSTDAGLTGTTSDTSTATSTTDAATGDSSTDASSTTDEDTTDEGTTGDGMLGPAAMDAMDALETAVAGVTYPSESDYPWVVVGFAGAAPVTEANVKQVIAAVYVPHEGEAALVDRAIEPRTLAQLIDPLTTPQDWWDDYNKMVAAQYTEIRAVLESKLVDIQVFRLGEQQGNVLQGAVDIYVLGATPDGDVVGMWTVSIET